MTGEVLDRWALQRRADELRRAFQGRDDDGEDIFLDELEEDGPAAPMGTADRQRAAARLLGPIDGGTDPDVGEFSDAEILDLHRMSWGLVTVMGSGDDRAARFRRQAAQHGQTVAFVRAAWRMEEASPRDPGASAGDDPGDGDHDITDEELDAAFEDLFDFLDVNEN